MSATLRPTMASSSREPTEKDPAPEQIWDTTALRRVPPTHPMPDIREEGVVSLCFEAEPWHGRATRVFAFLGVPEGTSADRPAPGVVLVHGGRGTAYAGWVRRWTERGYAAIAFDHFGQFPVREGEAYQRNPDAFPQTGPAADIDKTVHDQWPYHAVANTLLAHSLLASMPGVEADRIGLVGVSWGAVMAAIVAGVDTRFRFFVPIYGCGYISQPADDGSQFLDKEMLPAQRERWNRLWDPANHLTRATLPTLWLTGTNDFAFTPRSVVQSSRLGRGRQAFTIRPGMEHGQEAAEEPEETYVFADSILRGGPSLPLIIESGADGDQAWVAYGGPRPIDRVELLFTRDAGPWQDRRWEARTIPAQNPGGNRAVAKLPSGTTAHFFNVKDDRRLLASSEPAGTAPFPQRSSFPKIER